MADQKVAPYGSWRSPVTSDLIVSSTIRLGQVVVDGEDVYWIEGRPSEGGRAVIVRRTPDGRTTDITPSPFNARTRVHEYGGGDFMVSDGIVFFSNFVDQRLYRQEEGGVPFPITPEGDLRYADAIFDSGRNRIICVCEDHTEVGREPVNSVVSLHPEGSLPTRSLLSGHDFYSSMRLSPDGSRLSWLAWNLPNMPWDGTELWVGEIEDDGSVGKKSLVAGGPDESIFQPEWSPDGLLYFVSDRSGWWNIYRWLGSVVEPVVEMEAELAQPQWGLGTSTYGFSAADRMICAIGKNGTWNLASVDTATGDVKYIELPYTEIARNVRVSADQAIFVAGSPTVALSIIRLDLKTMRPEVLRSSGDVGVDAGYLSTPQAIEFPTEGGLTAHAFYYPPRNDDYCGPPDELPPLLVKSHGGPTAATSTSLNFGIQYWTSRGIAILDVNYGGSTGYGRAYRQRLDNNWGIVDVDDCVNVARYLVERGLVNGNRLAISGGSAGGYTTLAALTFRDTFKAGASHYGVGDLEALARDTHKFESRYLDRLIGPYPERRDIYVERSPIYSTDRLSCPVILFQGLDDKIVPPNQAELMAEALRKKGLPVAHVTFEGEGHGFRRAENIKRALDGELYFYSKVFGFDLGDAVEPVPIENI